MQHIGDACEGGLALWFKPWRLSTGPNTSDKPSPKVYLEGVLTDNLELNVLQLQEVFAYPDNLALRVRRVYVQSLNMHAVILYIEGAADARAVEENMLKPMLELEKRELEEATVDRLNFVKDHVLASLSIKLSNHYQDIVDELLSGNTILLLPEVQQAIVADTRGFKHRNISEPTVEQAISGPKEAFVEAADVNRSLIRKYLKDNQLQCEMVHIGQQRKHPVYLMYLRNIASEQIVDRVKRRIEQVQSDNVPNLYILGQHLEDRPYSLLPSVMLTERPDRVAAFLQEGHTAVVMDNSPVALIAPITFWSLFHAAEDQYNRWLTGNFMRLMRITSILLTMLIPAVYIAISTFHVEMLPTDLMLAISAARERVPFPVLAEILFMELSFELLRESGVRVPAAIGSTIGIVGALVLGQAAVDANLVSPILVIIVAITGLASYIVPDITLNFSIRIQRFIFIVFAAWFGFFGLALYMTYVMAYLVSFKSFGVPFMSPVAPSLSSANDTFLRPPVWKQWVRPANLSPKDKIRSDSPERNN